MSTAPRNTRRRLARTAGTSTITILPSGNHWSDPVHAFRAADDVWFGYAGNGLVHYDGKSLEPEQSPASQPISSLSLAPDGTLWLAAKSPESVRGRPPEAPGELWRRGLDRTWTRVALPEYEDFPEGARGANSVVALGNSDVWVTASGRLLHTGPPVPVERFEWDYGQQLASGSFRLPKAATPECKDLFVLMYGLTRVAPADYDYPLTRAALKGHPEFVSARFVETTENGRRFFGAFVADHALGKKLVALVQKQIKGSKPQLLCHQPSVTRRFDIDLATGALRGVTAAGT